MISTLCNHGIRPRHWKQMSDIIGFDITPDSGSTLRKFLKFNLGPCMTEFEAISVAASKVRRCYIVAFQYEGKFCTVLLWKKNMN